MHQGPQIQGSRKRQKVFHCWTNRREDFFTATSQLSAVRQNFGKVECFALSVLVGCWHTSRPTTPMTANPQSQTLNSYMRLIDGGLIDRCHFSLEPKMNHYHHHHQHTNIQHIDARLFTYILYEGTFPFLVIGIGVTSPGLCLIVSRMEVLNVGRKGCEAMFPLAGGWKY